MGKQGCVVESNVDVNPPIVKRGLDSHSTQTDPAAESEKLVGYVGMHWLRGTVPWADLDPLVQYLRLFFGDCFEEYDYGLWKYDRSYVWPNRVSLNYHSSAERAERITSGGVTLEIPGSVIETYAPEIWFSFMRGLQHFRFEPSRIDVYYDDYDRLILPRDLYTLVYELDLLGQEFRREFTGFLQAAIKQKVGGKRAKMLGGGRGIVYDEVAFGRRGNRGCGKYLRAYDKWLESRGERKCVRWELELSGHRARKMWEALMHVATQDIPGILGAAIGGCIDFRHRPVTADGKLLRAGDKNWKRCPRFAWWQKIVDKLGEATFDLPIHRKSVEQSWEWMKTAAAGTLQMLSEAWGADKLVPKLLDIIGSRDRLNRTHQRAINEYRESVAHDSTLDISKIRSFADEKGIQLESEPGESIAEEVAPAKRRFTMTGRDLWPET